VCGSGLTAWTRPSQRPTRVNILQWLTKVRKLDRLLDKEDRNVVADNIPITLLGIELDRKASNVSDRIRAATAALNSGEPQEHGRGPRGVGQHSGVRDIFQAFVQLEMAVCCGPSSVDHTLRDTFVIESMNLKPSACMDHFGRCHILVPERFDPRAIEARSCSSPR